MRSSFFLLRIHTHTLTQNATVSFAVNWFSPSFKINRRLIRMSVIFYVRRERAKGRPIMPSSSICSSSVVIFFWRDDGIWRSATNTYHRVYSSGISFVFPGCFVLNDERIRIAVNEMLKFQEFERLFAWNSGIMSRVHSFVPISCSLLNIKYLSCDCSMP